MRKINYAHRLIYCGKAGSCIPGVPVCRLESMVGVGRVAAAGISAESSYGGFEKLMFQEYEGVALAVGLCKLGSKISLGSISGFLWTMPWILFVSCGLEMFPEIPLGENGRQLMGEIDRELGVEND